MLLTAKKTYCFWGSFVMAVLHLPVLLAAQPLYSSGDSVKVFSLLEKADQQITSSQLSEAQQSATEALEFSRQKKFLRGEANAHTTLADIYYRRSESPKMGYHDSASLKIGLQLKDSFLIALSYYQLGQMLLDENKITEAQQLFNKALQLKFEKDQSSYTAVVYNDMGFAYGAKGEHEKQIEWLLKAMRLYDKIDDPAGMSQTLSNLSTAYWELGRRKEAFDYAKRAIVIREKLGDADALSLSYNNLSQLYLLSDQLDSAIKYLKPAIKYAEASGLKSRLAQTYISMGLILNRQGKNQDGVEYEKKAIEIYKETGNNHMLATRYLARAIYYFTNLKDSVGAALYFQKSYDIARATNDRSLLRDIYYYKTIFYKEHKDFYNAYENIKLYIRYRDTVTSEETQTKIAELQTQYETEKKDNEITRLNADQQIKQLELEKQQAVIAGNKEEAKRKQNEIDLLVQGRELQQLKIQKQEEELEKQVLLSKTRDQQLKLAQQETQLNEKQLENQKQLRNGIIYGTLLLLVLAAVSFNRFQLKKKLEQQKALQGIRNDIARDLHDEIGSTLTSINILSTVSQKNIDKNKEKTAISLQQITEQSQQMQQAMSDIVWAIRPDNDKMENMVIRMREFVSHTLESKEIGLAFDVDKNILPQTLSMEQRRDFFLIFKEAVNNAAKYSQAKKVSIDLKRQNGYMQLSVSDDGKGFETNRITSSNGIKNMKERASSLHGTLQVFSEPGSGTTIQLQFPAT